MRLRSISPALAALAAAAAIAGCGGGSSDSSGSTASANSPGGAYGSTPSSSASTDSAPTGAATIKTTHGPLGTFLVDGQGRTLYLWEADKGSSSTCSGDCAEAWPPALTTGAPKASGDVKASLLGTTKRSDGTTEVTYDGHPLYRYFGDRKPGDTTGQGSQGFGAGWYVVATSGHKIDNDD
jgi:predicted lipoprotein with Yx(FWY)xxD motif